MLGVIIASLTAAALLGAVLLAWWRARRILPQVYHRGVGIKYREDTLDPWPGLEQVIDALIDTIMTGRLARHDQIRRFWIEVVPYHREVTSHSVQTGYLRAGRHVPKPRSEEDARSLTKVTGTVDTVRVHPFAKLIYVIRVLQMREHDDPIDMRLGLGEGPIADASVSAIWHEHAQHLVPRVLGFGWNPAHNLIEMTDLEDTYRTRHKLLQQGMKTFHD